MTDALPQPAATESGNARRSRKLTQIRKKRVLHPGQSASICGQMPLVGVCHLWKVAFGEFRAGRPGNPQARTPTLRDASVSFSLFTLIDSEGASEHFGKMAREVRRQFARLTDARRREDLAREFKSGNHHEFEMDRGTFGDGQLDSRFQPAWSQEKDRNFIK